LHNKLVKDQLENEMNNNDFDSNLTLNKNISYDEIEKQIFKLKNKKAAGIDGIPNEILKHKDVMLVLYKLFDFCFNNQMIPSDWSKAIICPIPKGSDKNPYLPLSYRGISLLPCISKVYTGILNYRLINYLEELDLLADEQNGFRPNRSCEDHVFVLTSIIQKRLWLIILIRDRFFESFWLS